MFCLKKIQVLGTFLVVQWKRICLPMQGTWVQSLVWEDPTCRGANKPVWRNYWSPCAATIGTATVRSLCTAMESSPHSVQGEKSHTQQRKTNATKNKYILKKENPICINKLISRSRQIGDGDNLHQIIAILDARFLWMKFYIFYFK